MTDEHTIHAAVTHCHEAWIQALETYARKEKERLDLLDPLPHARRYAGLAFRSAMPYLSSPTHIDAYIACVAHGMAIGAIDLHSGAKLLYAAQISITARRLHQQQQPTHPQPASPAPRIWDEGTNPPTPSPTPTSSTAPPTPSPSISTKPFVSNKPPNPANPVNSANSAAARQLHPTLRNGRPRRDLEALIRALTGARTDMTPRR